MCGVIFFFWGGGLPPYDLLCGILGNYGQICQHSILRRNVVFEPGAGVSRRFCALNILEDVRFLSHFQLLCPSPHVNSLDIGLGLTRHI